MQTVGFLTSDGTVGVTSGLKWEMFCGVFGTALKCTFQCRVLFKCAVLTAEAALPAAGREVALQPCAACAPCSSARAERGHLSGWAELTSLQSLGERGVFKGTLSQERSYAAAALQDRHSQGCLPLLVSVLVCSSPGTTVTLSWLQSSPGSLLWQVVHCHLADFPFVCSSGSVPCHCVSQ